MKINVSEDNLLWAPYYEAILTILGSNGLIIPIGDTNHENSGRTTCTSVGDEQVIFTYSEAVTSFDAPPKTIGPGRIPTITFNGTDEEADSPDAAFWTRDDAGGANGFSIGFWANFVDVTSCFVLEKGDGNGAGEWGIAVSSTDILTLNLIDDSANITITRKMDSAITGDEGSWTFYVVTYDGAGGGSAADTIVWYKNGSLEASTAANNGSYVGMDQTASRVVSLGSRGSSDQFVDGQIAGGPLAPFWTFSELTADAVLRLYQLERAALGV